MPRDDTIYLHVMTKEQLMAVTLRTLQAIYGTSKTRTPLEEDLVETACALLPAWSRGANPLALLKEFRQNRAEQSAF